jgi:hypothetical protein
MIISSSCLSSGTSNPDVRRAVTTGIPHLVTATGTIRLRAEIHQEVLVHFHPSWTHVQQDHDAPFPVWKMKIQKKFFKLVKKFFAKCENLAKRKGHTLPVLDKIVCPTV